MSPREPVADEAELKTTHAMETASVDMPACSPVSSMTGYARVASRVADAAGLTLTLKSVNHRFLDLQLRLPAGADALESLIRAAIKRSLARGHVECTLTLERPARGERPRPAPVFDLTALTAYVQSFRAAAQTLGLPAEPDLNAAAQIPGLLASGAAQRDTPEAEEQAALDRWLADAVPPLLDEALGALKAMRAREGVALCALLAAALDRLSLLASEVAALRGEMLSAQFARIAGRLDALVGGAFDRERVLAEAALIAERGDVEEEIARLETHIAHFRSLLETGGEAGKKLDFLLQEMNREANTLLSKTTGLTGGGVRITECGLAMKAEIEKLREQVQNIE